MKKLELEHIPYPHKVDHEMHDGLGHVVLDVLTHNHEITAN